MNLRAYSSLAAFMAHYAALRIARSDGIGARREDAPNPDDAATLIEMEHIIGELSIADRDSLHDDAPANAIPSGTAGRRRARAELKLRRLVAARGLLTG